jgi:hypothetical protein
LVRENVTQRDTDYHDTREGIALARQWLQSKCDGVEQFNTVLEQKRNDKGQFESKPDSYRSIANFLSKNGKAVHYTTVKNYLDVTDNSMTYFSPILPLKDIYFTSFFIKVYN